MKLKIFITALVVCAICISKNEMKNDYCINDNQVIKTSQTGTELILGVEIIPPILLPPPPTTKDKAEKNISFVNIFQEYV